MKPETTISLVALAVIAGSTYALWRIWRPNVALAAPKPTLEVSRVAADR